MGNFLFTYFRPHVSYLKWTLLLKKCRSFASLTRSIWFEIKLNIRQQLRYNEKEQSWDWGMKADLSELLVEFFPTDCTWEKCSHIIDRNS